MPPRAGGTGPEDGDEEIAKIYRYYLNALKESSALDFDDLLLKTVELFEQSDRVRSKYAQQFRFVMVDEYQDTNRPQYLLIRRLSEVHRNLAVVGDPDQSIYKWRGADLRNLLDFEHDFPEVTTVKLERNYRSTQIILDAASAVIRENRNRNDKHLWTDRKGGARITYFRGGDELEEADFITRTARGALADDVEATVAVLYRTNAQSRTIEDALMREGIAYKVVGGVRFYERREIKDALAYMRLVINPHDDVSLRRVINVPARGIGKGVMDTLEKLRAGHSTPRCRCSPPVFSPPLSVNSLWARLVRGLEESAFPAARGGVARRVSRFDGLADRRWRGGRRCPSPSARCWTAAATSRIFVRSAARKPKDGSRIWPSSSRRHASTKAGRSSHRSAASSIDCRFCPMWTRSRARATRGCG